MLVICSDLGFFVVGIFFANFLHNTTTNPLDSFTKCFFSLSSAFFYVTDLLFINIGLQVSFMSSIFAVD